MEDWFVEWFNSPYYHILYKNRNEEEAEAFVDVLVQRLALPKNARVLDLACGKGRHALQLNELGFEVIGIDLSDQSIAEAELMTREGLEFFVHDMRSLFWSDYFDLVVNLFTSFGYFHDPAQDQQTISSVAESLKPGGRFVIDFMNVLKVKDNLVDYEEKTVDQVKFIIQREVENNMIVKRIHVSDGDELELDFKEQVDALELRHFQSYFDDAGLKLVNTFGNYQLQTFDPKKSDRLIMVAKKPNT